MQVFRAILKYYVMGHIHVSLAVVALTLVTFREMNQEAPYVLLGFVFFGTLLAYNTINFIGARQGTPMVIREFLMDNGTRLVPWVMGSLFFYVFLPINIKLLALGFGALSFVYIVPVRIAALRNYAGLKLFIVAFVWAGITVLLPLEYEGNTSLDSILQLAIPRFFWIIVLTLPFDIRDMDRDLPHLKTWPQTYGINRTKIMGTLLLLLVGLWHAYFWACCPVRPWAFLITIMVTLMGLWGSSPQRNWWYAAFWIECIPLLWLALVEWGL